MTHPTNPDGEVTVTDELINYLDASIDSCEHGIARVSREFLIRARAMLSATQPAAVDREVVTLQHVAVAEDGGKLRWMTGRRPRDCELYAMPDGGRIPPKLYAAPLDKDASKPVAPSVEQDERGAFEAWYLHDLPREITNLLDRSQRHPEMYDDDSVEDAWTGWQAGVAHARAASTSANAAQGTVARLAWTAGSLYDAIEKVLLSYRLSHWQDQHESLLGLVDRLCDEGAHDISSGQHEIRLICDEIYNEVLTVAAPQPAQTERNLTVLWTHPFIHGIYTSDRAVAEHWMKGIHLDHRAVGYAPTGEDFRGTGSGYEKAQPVPGADHD